MKRYTVKKLQDDLDHLNERAENLGLKYRYVIELFNGTTWVSLATPEQMKQHIIQERLECGTPKECHQKAVEHFAYAVVRQADSPK